ncbi:MAG: hypothetical protein QOI44_598, partial [Actinomycetota bacterium]|nr:hypothetical protein [Actinomycetota bacterium]
MATGTATALLAPFLLAARNRVELGVELAVVLHAGRIELAARDRRLYRATGLLIVRAVVELALRRQLLDVDERTPQSLVGDPERDRAQPGRV